MTGLDELEKQAVSEIEGAGDTASLDAVRVKFLGKSGVITEQLKKLGTLPPEERKSFGAEVNRVKEKAAGLITSRQVSLETAQIEARLARETLDATLPARPEKKGGIHPVSQVAEEVAAILGAMGFSPEEGPNVEDDFHNFTALNIPENHPARQMHDTFYLKPRNGVTTLLRTHTSPVQIRAMKKKGAPIRVLAIGRTYRCDSDMTHTPMFHQVEGLCIDKNINMGHLKYTVSRFLQEFFGVEKPPVRFRPSFFPFTEPSAEVDIGCKRSAQEIKIGEGDDFLEVLGCGMVHRKVLENVGVDPDEYQGFAFGAGLERLAMLKYGIPDLRTFFESDIRWLEHYGFPAGEAA